MTRRLLWGVPAALYVVFALWYTNLGGALSDQEVRTFADTLADRGLPADSVARWRRFMEGDTGRQFLMVNLIDVRDVPEQVPGAPPLASSEEAQARYMAPMYPALFSRA